MGGSRVRSFISTFGGPKNNASGKLSRKSSNNASPIETPPRWETPSPDTPSPPTEFAPVGGSTPRSGEIGSRPASMIFSNNPPLMAQVDGTPPELSPIFSFLNIHTNKVYHEGYFLKLNDQDNHGRPCLDRQWKECYAQLVGTVLSLWDATALDGAGGQEVPATFINVADASIKMIETLPIRNGAAAPLNNVLSISSAGKNRYLLHFRSFHSMCEWTAAVRLAMFEHTSLYEAYTGSLIAAKGKHLNSIQSILAPAKFRQEDWARVRFGAGTPWRRCWFVINPPDEKQVAKARKALKKSAYDRLSIPVTGNIQFFETRKTKKAIPIATLTHVYSAYAIYPQSKALIDQSSLVKLEGRITIHEQNQSTTEGFVYVMPELHAAISGFEMMLRFLFPTFDTFNLYGRPTRLVADTNHIKSIMFAFPQERRFGYLDLMDITSLLQTPGSQGWSEAEWRRQLKEATQKRASTGRSRTNSVNSARPRYRSSISGNHFTPAESPRRPFPAESKSEFSNTEAVIREVPRAEPPAYHNRGMSDITGMQTGPRPGYSSLDSNSPDSSAQDLVQRDRQAALAAPIMEQYNSQMERHPALVHEEQLPPRTPPSPVASPPAFAHGPREMPPNRPYATTAQRLANNRMSNATLAQLTSVGRTGGTALASQDSSSPASDQQSQDQESQAPSPAPAVQFAEPTSSPNPQLTHQSSDEAFRFAVAMRASLSMDDRPATSSTTGSSSPQRKFPLDSSKSLKRKPLPQRQIPNGEPLSPGEPSLDDLRHTLDEDALNRIAPHLSSPVTPTGNQAMEEESVYDDAASTVSPDYASTHGSIYSKKSQKSTKPRMGVMKTVGEPAKRDFVIGDAHYSTEKPKEANPDIPSVDFGPTMTYMPTTGRPSTGDALRRESHQRKDSEAERYRLSVPSNTMDIGHYRSPGQEEHRRSMLWQPGMASNRPTTPGGGLTPEQYVQQRAAPSPPVHMHTRSPSNNTPPPQRPISGDWTQYTRPGSRMTSQELNYRPSSRGTSPMLNYDISNHLSAREQEHVARVTNSPFFNMSQDNRRPQVPVNPGGLVSTIDTRERERREMREGFSNQMVQSAINQRQHHMSNQQADARYYGSMYPAQSLAQHQPQSRPNAMYNMAGANRTWDAVHQMNRPEEPRRQSWYGQLGPTQHIPTNYQHSQTYAQHGVYPGNPNVMHH
ncbi:uncharacterized protein N7484_010100 [Penicillium longicatenatum]|uniref:uncharacterized protein n=1 Tax=Penicillium longicatenatum TaxID=1561947 RepID=UPI002549501A|nr:uncharacterized protein N7484_010100 [Penicillium longicatenatum]KAJ5636787.1 hypothetical protein N7484_010100 [Penicillium longicatenatum]